MNAFTSRFPLFKALAAGTVAVLTALVMSTGHANASEANLGVVSTPVLGSPTLGTNTFVYVANRESKNISAYSMSLMSGALSTVAGSPFAAGTGSPQAIAVHPRGKFVYVAAVSQFSTSNGIFAYTINATTGALGTVTGSPFAAGKTPQSVAVHPSGRYAYAVDFSGNNVYA